MWHPRWHNFGAKPFGWLEEIKMNFSLARIVNMGRIGLIHWIINISTASYGRLIIFTTLSAQKHWDLKSSLVTLHVTRLGTHQKLIKMVV
jgi:hypothetical protein